MSSVAAWLTLLVLTSAAAPSLGQRFAVTYRAEGGETEALAQLKAAGYEVVKHLKGFNTVAVIAPASAAVPGTSHLSRLNALDAVTFAEVDAPRFAIQPIPGAATSTPALGCSDSCLFKDKASPTMLPNSTFPPEILPWGVQMVQATAEVLRPMAFMGNTFICLIDSGVDATHPDLVDNNLQGCGPDMYHACPEEWDNADYPHGTHVAGTLMASQNGVGVIGVIPHGAFLYSIKVFNGSGIDVYYGTDFVETYQQCELTLDLLQLSYPNSTINMVVSMSLSANGSSAIEAEYFRRTALARSDIMWVAAAGNTLGPVGQPRPTPNWPADYPEVISVGAVDCNGTLAPFSSTNPDVELAGPGVNVLSDLATGSPDANATLVTTPPAAANTSFASPQGFSGLNGTRNISVTGNLVYCGLAEHDCPGAQGRVCLILRGIYLAVQKVQSCMASGGVGAIIYNRADLPGCASIGWSYEDDTSLIPTVTISGDQGVALSALLDANTTVTATVGLSVVFPLTVSYSGTSMATPHVSAVAARVWNLFPKCKAADVRAALRSSAKHMGKGAAHTRNYEYGYGIVQAADAALALSKAKCARA